MNTVSAHIDRWWFIKILMFKGGGLLNICSKKVLKSGLLGKKVVVYLNFEIKSGGLYARIWYPLLSNSLAYLGYL